MKHQLTVLLLGEVRRSVRGQIFQRKPLKSAPHYFEISVPNQVIINEDKVDIDGREVVVQVKGYAPDILVVQTSLEVPNIFDRERISILETHILEHAYEILNKNGGKKETSETYSVFTVSGYEGDPDQFFVNADIIASLLKSEKLKLDPDEVNYTLAAQIKYAENDATIIDWDGAFIFDPEGDVEATIELLTLANLQLLRYRILDRQLDERLEHMADLVKIPQSKFSFRANPQLKENLKKALKHRMESVTSFRTVEREIKLIGDWYSARIYDIATKKFKISEWRNLLKEKMEAIEGIYSIFIENFTLSSKDRAEFLQIILFFILQIGWLVLIILEFQYFTK
ncbi:MAG: hypothetical protein QMD50_00845 [Patescibacteria group bacterium]|nr:hypothetical protein [Patescibacteria group bacterium]